jgi:hypothetical protein
VALLESVETVGERTTKDVETPAAAILGAVGPGLGAPGPAVELGRHLGAERTSAPRLMSKRTQG